jgi:hypothetical protein
MAMTMKNTGFFDVTPCDFQNLLFIATANVVPSTPILFALIMELIHSSEKAVRTRHLRHQISKDRIIFEIPSVFTATKDYCYCYYNYYSYYHHHNHLVVS